MYIYENKLTGETKKVILLEEGALNYKDYEYYNIIKIEDEEKRLIPSKQFNELFRKMTKEEVKNELWKNTK